MSTAISKIVPCLARAMVREETFSQKCVHDNAESELFLEAEENLPCSNINSEYVHSLISTLDRCYGMKITPHSVS